jgi:methylglyoxal synthase
MRRMSTLPQEGSSPMLTADDRGLRRWRVALVAHDVKTPALVAFVQRHRACFKDWELLATASTGEALRDATGLRVRTVLDGARGGDVQIGAEMAAGEIDALIFLRDPLTAGPHEPDVAPLLRVADVHNVAVATNLAGAECLVRALSPARTLSGRN